MTIRQVDENQTRAALLIKQSKMARVIELHQAEGLSTFCVAERLKISEREVCDLLDEVTRGR